MCVVHKSNKNNILDKRKIYILDFLIKLGNIK